MITTNNTKLSSKDFFRISIALHLKKSWWFYPLMWLIALSFLFSDSKDTFQIFYIFFAVAYPILFLLRHWTYAHSKDNKIFLLERSYTIDEAILIGHLSDATDNSIKMEHIIKVVELNKHYILYISKAQFIYVSKGSFKSQEDHDWFKEHIVAKIKK